MSFTLHRGTTPVLVSMPHVGTVIPQPLRHRFLERAGQTEDTDWFLDRLYTFVKDLGASLIVPVESRYVIDLNRPSDNRPMYSGQNNTELCPTRFFTGDPLYRDGMAPSDGEVQERVRTYWQPYHDALRDETQRLKSLHGHAVLLDALYSDRDRVQFRARIDFDDGRVSMLDADLAIRTLDAVTP